MTRPNTFSFSWYPVEDAASYEDLWAALSPAERERFTKALRDSNSELAQQLLSSEEIEKVRIEPWWEAPGDVDEEGPSAAWRAQKRYGKRPAMMEIPEHMARTPPAPGKLPLLLYNLCAVMCVHVPSFRLQTFMSVQDCICVHHALSRDLPVDGLGPH